MFYERQFFSVLSGFFAENNGAEASKNRVYLLRAANLCLFHEV